MASLRGYLAGAAAGLAFGLPGAGQAAVIYNGSFEDIVVDWTANPALVQTPGEFQHRDANGVADKLYKPTHGFMLGVIQAGPNLLPTTIEQTFTTKGGVFSGAAAFLAQDGVFEGEEYNDYGFVLLRDALGVEQELFFRDIFDARGLGLGVGEYGYTPWTKFSTVLSAGTYTLVAGAGNGRDGENASFLLVDNFKVAEVPEPSTWAMILLGFLGLGAALRRRRAVAA